MSKISSIFCIGFLVLSMDFVMNALNFESSKHSGFYSISFPSFHVICIYKPRLHASSFSS